MIVGLGSDLVDMRRIATALERHGERFLARLFTDAERAKAARRADPVPTYARRFAAKEACAKALGTGFRRGVYWRDIGVVTLPGGKPSIRLTGGAAERAAQLCPPGMVLKVHLTMTDEPPMAEAVVILEALPAEPP